MMIVDGEPVDPRDVVEISNVSQRLFGNREPRPLQDEMMPKPPLAAKPE